VYIYIYEKIYYIPYKILVFSVNDYIYVCIIYNIEFKVVLLLIDIL